MNKLILITLLVPVIMFSGCGMKEMMEKTEKMQKIVLANCECDEAKLLSYSEENFRTSVHIEIIGTDAASKKEIAMKINDALKKEIKDYCDIDVFQLDFINKGDNEIVTIRYCKIDE